MTEPVYALILCYMDATNGFPMPYVLVVPDRVRQRAFERKGVQASWMIWSPIQMLSSLTGPIKQQDLECHWLDLMIRACYKILTDASNEEDEVQLRPLREMMWRIARKLNSLDWTGVLETTDDFVVFASDWSGFWVLEDLKNSLPAEKRRLLESRRLLFYEETTGEKAEFDRQLAAVEGKLAGLTERRRIAFWIHELAHLAAGEDGLLTRRRWNESVALSRLRATGGAASLPLLDLAVRLDAMPHQSFDGQPSTSSEILEAVFSTLDDIGRADLKIETRLRKLLTDACKVNQGRERWTRTPFCCASSLWKLFHYPPASTDILNVLCDAEKYLSVPFKAKPS